MAEGAFPKSGRKSQCFQERVFSTVFLTVWRAGKNILMFGINVL
jgi:hypothetical protein